MDLVWSIIKENAFITAFVSTIISLIYNWMLQMNNKSLKLMEILNLNISCIYSLKDNCMTIFLHLKPSLDVDIYDDYCIFKTLVQRLNMSHWNIYTGTISIKKNEEKSILFYHNLSRGYDSKGRAINIDEAQKQKQKLKYIPFNSLYYKIDTSLGKIKGKIRIKYTEQFASTYKYPD